MNIGQDTSGGNRDISEQFIEFLVILDGERNVSGHNAALFIVAGGIAGQFQNFGAEILQDGREVDGGARTHAGRVLALTQVTTNTTDGELQTRLGRRSRR